ncbi:F0F1 ATP synthase subunit B [Haliovirga abyssi]|uniref:ATP synthase subunit b n=1 Tax=Haliovirga abyssi TaxID=2996794 RepID=A0AAU9DV70_9FUSO|nr:F0F1 ATP synthase subunit B [Haliovirga abyssi]BDU50011.1 ATP synthase subunit B [Haliovirga abyssi]
MGGNMPAVSLDVNMLFQMGNFILLLYVFARFMFKPMSKFLEERRQQITDDIETAKSNREKAIEMEKEMEKELKSAKMKSQDILNEAIRKTEDIKDDILKETHATREKMLKAAEADIVKMKEQVKRELRDEMTIIAIKLAEKMIEKKMSGDIEKNLLDQFIEEVGDAE